MTEGKTGAWELIELRKLINDVQEKLVAIKAEENGISQIKREVISEATKKLEISQGLLRQLLTITEDKNVLCWREHCARQELQAIQRASAAILVNLELDQVLEQIAHNVTEGIGFDRAVLLLVNKSSKLIQGKYTSGMTKEDAEKIVVSLERKEGVLYQAIWEGKSFNITDVKNSEVISEDYKTIKCHPNSVAVVPVTSSLPSNACWQKKGCADRGECLSQKQVFDQSLTTCLACEDFDVLGVLAVDNWESNRPITAENIESLQIFAQNAAIAIKNATLHQTVQKMAVTDTLTQLYNHGFLHEFLAREVANASRWGESLAIIMLDLDKFKQFNDTHGHPLGDKVLQKVAGILKQNIRKVDLAARYGGEEFTLVLTQTDAEGARIVAERVRQEIAGTIFTGCQKQDIKLTISAGIAVFEPGLTEHQLIQQADVALYQAKNAGRNRVIIFSGEVH